jgi:hypothetical protein
MSSRGRRKAGDHSGREWRHRVRILLLVASALFVFSLSSTSHAYPWMIRHGIAKCANCHTDPMGGETLTGFGRVMSDTTLSTRWGATEPGKRSQLFFGVEEPRGVNIGGSLRYMTFLHEFAKGNAPSNTTTFPMQIDAYGQFRLFDRLRLAGSIGVIKTRPGAMQGRAAQITTGDSGDYNLLSRSHWIGYDITDSVLLRAGRINLPFGIRMPEHTMWARAGTRTDRESAQQHGVALSYSGGKWRGEVMGILGNYQMGPDKFRERGYSAYAEYMIARTFGLGVSSLVTHAKEDRFVTGSSNTRQAHGLTARYVPVKPLTFMLEGDYLLSTQRRPGYVGLLQADLEFAQGLHGILTGEVLDQGKLTTEAGIEPAKGAGEPKFGGWVSFNWFFFTHFDMRVDLVIREQDQVTLLSQLHAYF